MSSISPLYHSDAQGWLSVNDSKITGDNRKTVFKETAKMAIIELAKAAGNAGMLTLVAIAAATVAFAVFKVAAILIGLIAFPTAIIPPLFTALTTLGGLTAGGIVGFLFTKKYGVNFFNQTKEHFNYSMHLFSEAKRVYKLEVNA